MIPSPTYIFIIKVVSIAAIVLYVGIALINHYCSKQKTKEEN